MMRTEVLEIDERFGKEYAGRYVFQEISWAKRSRIIQKHTKYNSLTGQIVSSDFIAIQAETIIASLREQPSHKPVTLEKLLSDDAGVSVELGELFSQIVNRLNSISLEEQRFLSVQSEGRSQTLHSQTSASAKNSAGHPDSSQSSLPKPSSSSS
jgi:hypothetical protein